VEDDLTVVEMRREHGQSRLDKPFMSPGELINIRTVILRVTQVRLTEQLLDPSTGEQINQSSICLWEKGQRPIPLWAARHIRALAEAARRYDERAPKQGLPNA
jgi:hypothetical protein